MNLKQPRLKLADPSRLPRVPGGWSTKNVPVGEKMFGLTLPADPDLFLGDEPTLATRPDDDYVPYWPHLWPAALEMAAAVAAHNWLRGTPALELGCGVGLVGLAALSAGLDVTFSDYEADAVRLALHNAASNGYGQASGIVLDWREPIRRRFPVILACEVVYEQRNHALLLDLLEQMLDSDGVCWIGDGGRQLAGEFIQLAEQRRFLVELSDAGGESLSSPRIGEFQLVQLRPSR